MKRTNKYLSLALAIIMALSLCVTSFAATINVTEAVEGQTYNAYKIFDVTKSDENYAYSIDSGSEWYTVVTAYNTANPGAGFTLVQVLGTTKYTVAPEANFSAANFAEYLNNNKSDKEAEATDVADATGASLAVGAGYYFIDSSMGALCALLTDTETVNAVEKNVEPTLVKEISKNNASIDEELTFTITVTAGGKADTTYVVHDTMASQLTLDETSFAVKKDGTDVATENYNINFTPAENHCTFEITFAQTYTATLEEGEEIVITYTAVLNETAESNTAYTNVAYVQYGGTDSEESTVSVKTYDVDLVKTVNDENGKTVLDGAKFELYDAATAGNKIMLVKVEDGLYRVASATEKAVEGFQSAVIDAGQVTVLGLGNGTYYFEETQAPEGYNMLTARQGFDIADANNEATVEGNVYVEGGVRVINQSGALLPSTGGVGTTMFYVLGSVMMIGAAILLVTKKKMANEQ